MLSILNVHFDTFTMIACIVIQLKTYLISEAVASEPQAEA
jgi:hypothetical protein